jgi:DnaJ-like protein/PilZ domain-containing protein
MNLEETIDESVVSVIENRGLTTDELASLASLIVDEPDHYTVLGVNRDASAEEIRAAYCLAVSYFHPLRSREITESDSVMHWKLSSAFLRIEEAFTVLSRQSRRKVYDANLGIRSLRNARGYRKFPQKPVRQQTQTRRLKDEQRRVPRVPLNIPVRVSFERQWQEITETLDVSPLGIRFRLSRPVEPGSEIRMELKMPRDLRAHSFDQDVYVVNGFVLYEANNESGRQVVAEFIF